MHGLEVMLLCGHSAVKELAAPLLCAGIDEVTSTSFTPLFWRGNCRRKNTRPEPPEVKRELFADSAHQAAPAYPKNVNGGTAIALADLEMDATRVRLVSSHNVTDPLGRVEARGVCGYFSFDIFARGAADNPKTSTLTAYSILQYARLRGALPVAGLCRDRLYVSWRLVRRAAHRATCPGVK